MKLKYFIIGTISTLIIILLLILIYYFGSQAGLLGSPNLNQTQASPAPQASLRPAPTPQTSQSSAQPTSSPSAFPSPQVSLLDNIIAAIISQNYAALKQSISDPVHVRLEASGCCGQLTPDEAIAQLDYLNNATAPWNFDPNQPAVQALQAALPQYYGGGAIVGISSDDYVVSFVTGDTGTITGINMAVDYHLVAP